MKTADFIKEHCVRETCQYFDDRYGCSAYDGEECDAAFNHQLWHGLKMADRVNMLCEKRCRSTLEVKNADKKEKKRKTSKMDKNMNTYMKKSPIYYAIIIQGFQNEFGWYLSNEDEIDEFAKKFDMDWHWNMRKGVLDFKDKSDGVKFNRPWNVKIGQVVIAYDDWGTWRVDLWDYDRFEKNFIRVESERFAQRSMEHGTKDEHLL